MDDLLDPELQAIADEAGGDTPPAEGAPPETAPPAAADPNSWRSSFEWKFKSGDKEVVVDSADKARTWLSQGHQFSQNQARINQERQAWLREREEINGRVKALDPYKEIDDYARQNPSWWEHVQSQFKARETATVPPELQEHLSPLMQRLQQTEGVLQQWQEQQRTEAEKAEDQKLDSEVQAIREKYPTIDLTAVDAETGRPLEHRILEHMKANGIQSFKTGFQDYLHDRLIDEARTSALSQQAKDAADRTKKGIIGTTRSPTKGLQVATTRGKSYDQLAQEGLAELGIN